MNNLLITKHEKDQEIVLLVEDPHRNPIVKYTFCSKTTGTELGRRIVLITLLRYAIMMTLNIDQIEITFSLDDYEKEYLESEIDNLVSYSLRNQSFHMKTPRLIYGGVSYSNEYPNIPLDPTTVFIGYSGGKDSQLCYELLHGVFEHIRKYKIDFETEQYEHDYHERIDIIDNDMYQKVSTEALFTAQGKDYYQEEDLHCCFAIPYWGVTINHPQVLSIGLQFDVVNDYLCNDSGEKITEFDLLETYDSLKKFEALMHYYGLSGFKVIVPLASITSFGIYSILQKKYGESGLRALNSCWSPTPDGKPCGKCLKCQRVSYIYNILGMELTDIEKASLELANSSGIRLDFLFGSITCQRLLENQDKLKVPLHAALFVDEKIEELDWGMSKKIATLYSLTRIDNPFKEK